MNFIEANEGDRVQTNDFKDIGTVVDIAYLEYGNGDIARRYVKVRGGWFLNDALFGSDITVLHTAEREDR